MSLDSKNKIVLFGVLLFIIVPELHLLMNHLEPLKVDLFLFVNKSQDIQWYVKDMLDYIALIIISYSFYKISPQKTKIISLSLLIINLFKIPLYWLFYLQFDWIINITIFTSCFIAYIYEKRNHIR